MIGAVAYVTLVPRGNRFTRVYGALFSKYVKKILKTYWLYGIEQIRTDDPRYFELLLGRLRIDKITNREGNCV